MDDNTSLYKTHILDHYKHPRNWGRLENPTNSTKAANLSCGDELNLDLQIVDGKIAKIGFNGQGCAISIAAMSMLSEKLLGLSPEDAQLITEDAVLSLLNMESTSGRTKCALLSLEAVKEALKTSTETTD